MRPRGPRGPGSPAAGRPIAHVFPGRGGAPTGPGRTTDTRGPMASPSVASSRSRNAARAAHDDDVVMVRA
ncbi:MAG TPA: hypothetical protein VFQ76_14690, partial [Longimicrobiaceae bacterium]|nr:hypothetical protein [Longimicrobiaceae bacterium]